MAYKFSLNLAANMWRCNSLLERRLESRLESRFKEGLVRFDDLGLRRAVG